ncbi:MAG TPA: RsmF rRNA methyltransferase first C-terminal domain-containing protein, partial [Clostridia bacterium]|nr:RsmF rRNA methyltransferase first C-terminal domain-containing protein [Clostridia bacterium]
ARLRRDGDSPPAPWPRARQKQAVPDPAACRDFLAEAAPGFPSEGRLAAFGQSLCLLPEDAPPIEGFRVLRCGLELGQPRHFQPAHALALALKPDQARRVQALDEAEAHAWLSGQALASRVGPGWTLAVHRGVPLGFGKSVQQLLKNHMPYKIAERSEPE